MAIQKPSLKWRLKHYTDPKFIRGWVNSKIAKVIPKITDGDVMTMTGKLGAKYLFKDGPVVNYRNLSYSKVTNDFASFLVDRLHTAGTDMTEFFYHAAGTDNTAESSGDTALGSEILRSTGSLTETSAQVFKTVATLTFPSTNSILEHAVFNNDTGSAAIMMDRSVYTAIEVVNSSDAVEFTYELTYQSGG